jgi:4-amino-4-deoxychorismate lyase
MIYNSELVDIDRHIEKLHFDSGVLNLSSAAVLSCRGEAKTLAAGCARGVLKILLWRGEQLRGYQPRTVAADRLLIRYPAPELPDHCWDAGVNVIRSPVTLAEQPRLAGIKHLNRLEQVLASADWPAGVAEALMGDAAGHPVCGTRSNLFWISRGDLYTPELTRSGVAGMMRDKVIQAASTLGLRCYVGRWTWQDLDKSEEIFMTNSLIGIWPVRALENRRLPAPGTLTARLAAVLAHPRLN